MVLGIIGISHVTWIHLVAKCRILHCKSNEKYLTSTGNIYKKKNYICKCFFISTPYRGKNKKYIYISVNLLNIFIPIPLHLCFLKQSASKESTFQSAIKNPVCFFMFGLTTQCFCCSEVKNIFTFDL